MRKKPPGRERGLAMRKKPLSPGGGEAG